MLIYWNNQSWRPTEQKAVFKVDGTSYYSEHQGREALFHMPEGDPENMYTMIASGSSIIEEGKNFRDLEKAPFPDTEPLLDKWRVSYSDKEILATHDYIPVNPHILDAVMTEIQPYWELDGVFAYIAYTYFEPEEISSATWDGLELLTTEGLRPDYQLGGAEAVEDRLEPFYHQPDVQAAFAESAQFLSLTQDQRLLYSQMEREDQYAMLFVDRKEIDSYLSTNQAHNLHNLTQHAVYQTYQHIDLMAIGEKLEAEGIDGYAWFQEEFKAETAVVKYQGILDVIDPIARLYTGVLGRMPEKDGYEWWINAFNTDESKTLEQMAADFAWSKEFLGDIDLDQGPTAEQLITALYKNVLGREPDEEGYLWWLEKAELAFEYDLRAGTVPGTNDTSWLSPEGEECFTFGRIVTGFTESEEFIEQTMADVYAIEVAHWGANLEDLVAMGDELGFEEHQLIGVETTHEDYFLI